MYLSEAAYITVMIFLTSLLPCSAIPMPTDKFSEREKKIFRLVVGWLLPSSLKGKFRENNSTGKIECLDHLVAKQNQSTSGIWPTGC